MPQQTQFVACPKCEGYGKDEKNLVCKECAGIALGTFIKNDFLYWGYDLAPAKIIVRQSGVIFDQAVNVISLIAGIGGIIALAVWIKNNALSADWRIYTGTFFSFWGDRDGLILYFWIGLIFLMFAYFRYFRHKQKYPPVKLRSYRQMERLLKKRQIVPNNWRELKSYRTKIDVSKSYESDLIKLLEKAYSLAMEFKHKELLPAHVLLAAINSPEEKERNIEAKRVTALFARLDIHRGKMGPKLKEALQKLEKPEADKINKEAAPAISRQLRQGLVEAYLRAGDSSRFRIGMLDLIVSLASEGKILRDIFNGLGTDTKEVADAAQWMTMADRFAADKYSHYLNRKKMLKNNLNAATDAVATPILNYYCDDIIQEIKNNFYGVFAGREREIKDIFQAFIARKNRIVFSGKSGSGRMAVVKNLAALIIEDNVPRVLHKQRLLLLNVKKVNEESPGVDLEQKLSVIVHELEKSGNAILVVENMSGELWDILSRASGRFRIIAAADSELSGVDVHNIKIKEPDEESLKEIIFASAVKFEDKYKVAFNYSALKTVLRSGREYLTEGVLPERAVNLLARIAQKAAAVYDRNITDIIVAKIVAQETGIPYTKIMKSEV